MKESSVIKQIMVCFYLIKFEGKEHSLSSAALIAKNSLGFTWKTIAGPLKWLYKGETLDARREIMENE